MNREGLMGNIDINSKNGIYGHISAGQEGMFLKKMPVAYKQELKTGSASLLCCVDGKVQEYQAER